MLGTKKVLMQVVHEGRSLSTLFDAFNEVERPAIQSLTYATLRDWTHAQIRLYKHLSKKPSKELDVLLTVAAMLINNRAFISQCRCVCPHRSIAWEAQFKLFI